MQIMGGSAGPTSGCGEFMTITRQLMVSKRKNTEIIVYFVCAITVEIDCDYFVTIHVTNEVCLCTS